MCSRVPEQYLKLLCVQECNGNLKSSQFPEQMRRVTQFGATSFLQKEKEGKGEVN